MEKQREAGPVKPMRVWAGTLRVIGFYLVFGGIWIAVSDRVLELFVGDPHRLTRLQTYKGWVFILASAALIALSVRRELGRRVRSQEQLRVSEDKYHSLFESANDAIVLFDPASGAILEANRRAGELVGRPGEPLAGKPIALLHPPEEAERCRELFAEATTAPGGITRDACVYHVDARRIPVEVSLTPVTLEQRPLVLGIFRDVTERERAQQELRREKERAQTYLDIAGVVIVVIGADARVLMINRRGAELLGAAEAGIVGRDWFDLAVPERLRPQVRDVFARLMRGEGELPEYHENPVVTGAGAERLIAWHNALVRDAAGAIVGTISSGEDITDRRRAEEQAASRLRNLAALHSIDLVIGSTLNLGVTLREFVERVQEQLGVDAVDVLLVRPRTQTLEHAAGRGFRGTAIAASRLRLGEGLAGVAALERRSVAIPDLNDPASGFVRGALLADEGFLSYYGEPLIAKGRVTGVLEVFSRSKLELDAERRDFLRALGAQAAIAIDNAGLFEQLERSNIELTLAYDATLEGWARALDLRNQATERHTERVTEMTVRLARKLGVGEDQLVQIRRGALLHDIGKIGVPDAILLKQGPLTDEEMRSMRRHPTLAFEMLRPIAYLRPALDIPYAHHERWDGGGYPRGLAGEQIPLAARIFSVVDVYDALRSPDRPYREPMTEEGVRAHLAAIAGTQLDPKVVEVFLAGGW
jgi:PAS domain S-box-containing protein/putative nucleotidyltransferase with HDIG domain